MHESRKSVSSASVIWYTILFRQNRTDRPLVRKPGAFAAYRYRDDLFPTLAFRRAYDTLCKERPTSADREYLRVLHLAATISESEVEMALQLLEEAATLPTCDAVRGLVDPVAVPQVVLAPINLAHYDQLLVSRRCVHA